MTSSGIQLLSGTEARPYGGPAERLWLAVDEHVVAALHDMTVDDLRQLRGALVEARRGELSPSLAEDAIITNYVARQLNTVYSWLYADDGRERHAKTMVLLGAVAVAIAWWTYRTQAAPLQSIRHATELVDEGHQYMLPIPRGNPCFCGSDETFKGCHGRPPHAAPLVALYLVPAETTAQVSE